MPFDDTIGFNTDPQYRPKLSIETSGSEFIPDVNHIAPDLVLLSDGSVMAMVRVPGYPFELESMRTRNTRRRQNNDLIRGIADDNVTLSVHLVRHNYVPELHAGQFRSRFAAEFFRKRVRNCLSGRLMSDDWFLTVIVSPRFSAGRAMHRRLSQFLGAQPAKANASVVRQMRGIMQSLMAYLGKDGGVQLGLRKAPSGHTCSEIAEARRLILMGRWQPVPLTTGLLGDAIYTERVTCGTVATRINGPDGPRFAKTIAIKDYPDETRTGQFSHLINIKDEDEQFPFVLAQNFRFQGREAAATRLYLKIVRMENAFDSQKRGMEKLEDAREDVVSGETVRGYHNLGLTVFGPTVEAVNRAASAASSAMVKAGAIPIHEDGNSFAAYWSMLPGNPDWLEGRSGSLSSRNLTAFASLESFPSGETQGHWGPPLIRFATAGNTAFDYVPHVGDVGHTLFLGRTGSGKTLLMTMLVCALEQAIGDTGTVVFFDKDQGAEPMVRATGGSYLTLKSGEPSGMAPLRGLSDTPASRAFLEQWIAALMTDDDRGPLLPKTTTMLRRAVARQMKLPPDQRSLGAVRAFLGFGEGTDGDRLDRWCEGGSLGWLFDNQEDLVRLDAPLIGFDMTRLLKHPACPMVGAYLIHRVSELIDGRRIAVICDECKFYLLSPIFAEMIEDFSLTLRKKNGMLWLAAQEPEHITDGSVGASLARQAQTVFVFPAKEADPKQFMGKLGFTSPMFRAITEDMHTLPYRTVLMKRDSGSAILRTELFDMADEIEILSGHEDTARLIPDILKNVGSDPEAFASEFVKRARAIRQKPAKQGELV